MHEQGASGWVRLRAGVPVVRRDDTCLQVGAHPTARVVLTASAAHTALLERLVHGLDPATLTTPDRLVVDRLAASGLLVRPDERDLRHRRRAGTAVEVSGPAPWRDDLVARLVAAGVGTAPPRDDPAPVTVVLSSGEPDRAVADACLRTDSPTLLVAAVDGRVRLGPWVVPGTTACLHCLDAHARERDPRHPVLLEQWRGGGPVVEVEPSLVALALAWACADVVRWCHGERPTTWSATLWLDEAAAPERTEWTRHPWCGCSWSALDVTG